MKTFETPVIEKLALVSEAIMGEGGFDGDQGVNPSADVDAD